MNIRQAISNKTPIILDGSMGAMLIDKGIEPSKTAAANIENLDLVAKIHSEYLEAGCDVILTNTFNLSPQSVRKSGYSLEELITGGVNAALKAKENYPSSLTALDIGPLGELIVPYGKTTGEEAFSQYKRMIEIALGKIDLIVFETFSALEDIEAAVKAARAVSDIPVFASMSMQASGKSWIGVSLEKWIRLAETLDIDALGLNCTLLPSEMLPLIKTVLTSTQLPVFAEPNRGQPQSIGERTIYEMGEKEYADGLIEIYQAGVNIIGGCCGSDPKCMKLVVEGIKNLQ